jgi:hypothetical protein
MRWAGHVEQIEERVCRLLGMPEQNNHLYTLDVEGRVILKWILRGMKWMNVAVGRGKKHDVGDD